MISRIHRFHGYNSLRFVYRQGAVVRGPFLSLRYVKNTRRQTWRAAVVVSRKISKSAVVRNRIRRRIFEILRQHETQILDSFDIVIIIFSPQILELDSKKLAAMIQELFEKAAIINPSKSITHAIVETKEK